MTHETGARMATHIYSSATLHRLIVLIFTERDQNYVTFWDTLNTRRFFVLPDLAQPN